MAYNEQTSETIAEIAAVYAHHPDPKVRRMAMSLLTQRPDQPKPGTLTHYNALTRGAHVSALAGEYSPLINALATGNPLLDLARR